MEMAPLYEKEFVVVGVNPIVELTTGDTLQQVVFGEYVDATPEVLGRIPQVMREGIGKRVGVNEVTVVLKKDEIPYRIGSKWKLTINQDGEIKVAESK
jgi:hypothetical protein